MHQQQSPEALEFAKGKVRCLDSSHALVSVYAAADLRFLYHVDVVCPITDGQCNLFKGILDRSDNLSFLFGCDSATHNRLTVLGYVDKLIEQLLVS